jgi:hypothetical protein
MSLHIDSILQVRTSTTSTNISCLTMKIVGAMAAVVIIWTAIIFNDLLIFEPRSSTTAWRFHKRFVALFESDAR